MTVPTLDQTEGVWIGRTSGQGYHYIQDIFPGDTPREVWHRTNCQALIARGHLQAEYEGNRGLVQDAWTHTLRYMRVHA
jgi:hypothetical protein